MFVRTILSITALGALLGGCATNTPPAISYDQTQFKPGTAQNDPAQPHAPSVPVGAVIGPLAASPDVKMRGRTTPTARVETANRHALREPTRDDYINAAQVYPFSDNALYRLYTAPQQVSDIALQPGETLSAISAGDTVRWAVGDSSSGTGQTKQIHVLVKPFAAGLSTNLVILTDRRSYHLELHSTEHVSMAAVSWSYPDDSLIAEKGGNGAVPASSAPIDTAIALQNINFRYAISGDTPPWRPLRAFDDGHKVYIEFPERIDQGEAPPLFVVGVNASSVLVNYRVRGNYYIVDRLFGAAELRLGEDKQQVVRISRTDGKSASARSASLLAW